MPPFGMAIGRMDVAPYGIFDGFVIIGVCVVCVACVVCVPVWPPGCMLGGSTEFGTLGGADDRFVTVEGTLGVAGIDGCGGPCPDGEGGA